MLTIFLITRNRDEGLKNCLDSVVKNMTGEYVVLVANCSDNRFATEKVISKYENAFSFRLDPTTPIHTCYNILVQSVVTEYFTWLSDDTILLRDIAPLVSKLNEGYDTVALPMEDVITYINEVEHDPVVTDEHGCMVYYWKERRLANYSIVRTEEWKSRLTQTKPMQQIDLAINIFHKNQYWPDGKWLLHTRLMDETRKNRKL